MTFDVSLLLHLVTALLLSRGRLHLLCFCCNGKRAVGIGIDGDKRPTRLSTVTHLAHLPCRSPGSNLRNSGRRFNFGIGATIATLVLASNRGTFNTTVYTTTY